MSNKKLSKFGNDTIDRYPPAYEGKVRKILCISKEVFKKLKATLAEFGLKPKIVTSKPKTPFCQKPLREEPPGGPRNGDHRTGSDKCIGSFEPSNIFNIRFSSLWRERNLGAWFKEQESYEDQRYLNPNVINKKRHILI